MWLIIDFWPVFALGGVATIFGLGCLYLWRSRRRYRRQVVKFHAEVTDVAAHTAFGKRISTEVSEPELTELGDTINQLFDALHDKGKHMRQRIDRMSYQAAHDALTGLINRREFERLLDLALQASRSEGVSHVLCYLDLDRFKAVNDSVGHLAGDTMLREIAGLAREEVRESDFVARLGGDEFGMLLVGCPLDKARQIADKVCSAVRGYRFVWQDKIFSVGVSVGLVQVGPESGSNDNLLSAADSACYVAKQQGRNRVHVYSGRDEAVAWQRGEIHQLQKLQTAEDK